MLRSPLEFMTFIVVSFLLVMIIVNQFGILSPDSYDLEQVKSYLNSCEDWREDLNTVQEDYNELSSLDLTRAYTECREDLRDERDNDSWKLPTWIVITGLLLLGTYHMTKDHYQIKSNQEKQK